MDIVQPVQAVLNTLENSALTILQLLDTILTNLEVSLNKATQKMKMLALDLWRLFRNLLSADEQLSYQKKFTQHKAEKEQLGTKRTWIDEPEGGEQELGGTTTEVDNVDNWETVSDEGEILSGKPDMMNQRTYLNKRERKQTL